LNTISISWDLSNFKACTSLKSSEIDNDCQTATTQVPSDGACCYTSKDQFLYLYVF
jgi:hypothetical protein